VNVHIHPYLSAFWLVVIIAKTAVAILLWTRPWRNRSYFFTAFVTLSLARSVTLFAFSWMGWAEAYTWLYWIGSGVLHGLAFATAYDCFRQLFWPFRKLPQSFAYALLMFTSLLMVLVLFFHVAFPDSVGDLGANLLTIDRTETWGICGLLWIISTASDWLGIPWRARPFGIFLGFLFTYSVDIFVSAVRGFTHWQMAHALWPIGFVTELICLLIWAFYFTRKEPELTSPNPDQLAEIQRILARFFAKPDPRGSPDDAA
jgi:hypothetical protein